VIKRQQRVAIGLAIGLACGIVAWVSTKREGFEAHDFRLWWRAANAILEGQDPYTTIFFRGLPGFVYPLPCAILTIPFARLPVTIAGSIFIGVSCGILAFYITRSERWPLLMFASGAMYLAVAAGQFTPFLTLGFVSPLWMWVGALKPNIGLAMLAYRPSWKGALAMLLVSLLSLIVIPDWPVEWLNVVRHSPWHYAAILGPGGFLLLFSLLKWRRPEGRMLAAMAVLPTSPIVYETLPLFLVARTRIEVITLALLSSIAHVSMVDLGAHGQLEAFLARGRWIVLWLCYIPALAMVLRRPNRGDLPAILERASRYLPAWLRGRGTSDDAFGSSGELANVWSESTDVSSHPKS
jgi:hypothetical protein